MILYAIRDIVAGAIVGPPFPGRVDAVANREFYQLLGDKRTQLSQHPQDYELIAIGEYNDGADHNVEAGYLYGSLDKPRVVSTGKTWLEVQNAGAES